jgi:hypothetical protein
MNAIDSFIFRLPHIEDHRGSSRLNAESETEDIDPYTEEEFAVARWRRLTTGCTELPAMTASTQKAAAPRKVKSIMASVVFPPELHRTLKEIAKREKVSFAWVVRRAAEEICCRCSERPKTKGGASERQQALGALARAQ